MKEEGEKAERRKPLFRSVGNRSWQNVEKSLSDDHRSRKKQGAMEFNYLILILFSSPFLLLHFSFFFIRFPLDML